MRILSLTSVTVHNNSRPRNRNFSLVHGVHIFVQASDVEATGETASTEADDDNDDNDVDDDLVAVSVCSLTSESHETIDSKRPLRIAG